ncbi:MAG: hypothetical protein K2X93_19095 [Candidatus Obscuribacterales bacterium]|nr:hypothetical protein [Candidatus Obscuribacterales bacterium]
MAAMAFVVEQMTESVGLGHCPRTPGATTIRSWADRMSLLLNAPPAELEFLRPYVMQDADARIIRLEDWHLQAGFELLNHDSKLVNPYILPRTASRFHLCGKMVADPSHDGTPRLLDHTGLTTVSGRLISDNHLTFILGKPDSRYVQWIEGRSRSKLVGYPMVELRPVTADSLTEELFEVCLQDEILPADVGEYVRAMVGLQETEFHFSRYDNSALSLTIEERCYKGERTFKTEPPTAETRTVAGAMSLVRRWLAEYLDRKASQPKPSPEADD